MIIAPLPIHGHIRIGDLEPSSHWTAVTAQFDGGRFARVNRDDLAWARARAAARGDQTVDRIFAGRDQRKTKLAARIGVRFEISPKSLRPGGADAVDPDWLVGNQLAIFPNCALHLSPGLQSDHQ